ncbi:MAG: hypothetical protein KC593_22495 [Myxococcales bacterium]|nr:hypothetical protein [Myxococcales bacterium]MCB9628371.1 hypothetical protein [Sandaracinaceae bacterium]
MSLRNVGRGVSGLVLGASLLVHLLTFVPSVAINMDFVWPLHVGAMASFLVMFVGLIHVQSALRKSTPQADSPSSRLEMRREFNRRVWEATPLPVKVLFPLAMLYVLYNFFASIPAGGTPDLRDGVYVLHNHGTVVREITLAEYERFRTLTVRGFSGHWMIFSAVPLVFYTWLWPRLHPAE